MLSPFPLPHCVQVSVSPPEKRATGASVDHGSHSSTNGGSSKKRRMQDNNEDDKSETEVQDVRELALCI